MSTASEAARCKSGIERGVNAETLRKQIRLGEMVEQMFLHHVHEIGRGAAFESAADNLQRNFLGVARLFGGDGSVFRHGQQGAVARLDRALRTAFGRRVAVWRVDDSRQKCGFRQGSRRGHLY